MFPKKVIRQSRKPCNRRHVNARGAARTPRYLSNGATIESKGTEFNLVSWWADISVRAQV